MLVSSQRKNQRQSGLWLPCSNTRLILLTMSFKTCQTHVNEFRIACPNHQVMKVMKSTKYLTSCIPTRTDGVGSVHRCRPVVFFLSPRTTFAQTQSLYRYNLVIKLATEPNCFQMFPTACKFPLNECLASPCPTIPNIHHTTPWHASTSLLLMQWLTSSSN